MVLVLLLVIIVGNVLTKVNITFNNIPSLYLQCSYNGMRKLVVGNAADCNRIPEVISQSHRFSWRRYSLNLAPISGRLRANSTDAFRKPSGMPVS